MTEYASKTVATPESGSRDAQLNGPFDFILIPDHQSGAARSRLELSAKNAKKIFQKKFLYRRFPILNWLPRYSREDAIGDLIASIPVALATIPLALAFADIAGLPTEVSSFMC